MSDPDGVMLDPERIAARIVEDILVPVYGVVREADLRRHMLERVAAILREELAGPERPWPTREDVARLVLRWAPPPHADSADRVSYAGEAAAAILALFPAPDARLLADFRWLAGKFVYEDGAGRRSTGPDVEIELREWQKHVALHLEEPHRG